MWSVGCKLILFQILIPLNKKCNTILVMIELQTQYNDNIQDTFLAISCHHDLMTIENSEVKVKVN